MSVSGLFSLRFRTSFLSQLTEAQERYVAAGRAEWNRLTSDSDHYQTDNDEDERHHV